MKLSKPQKQIYNMESIMNGSVSCVCGCMLLDTVKTEAEINDALNIMYRMNDALRIRLIKNGETVSQYITEYKELSVPALHFDSREELNAYAESYAKIPFASDGSLSEITPVILPSYSGVLIKMHHIISDGWTCALVASQMKLLLTGYDITAYSYADYLATEEEYLSGKRYKKDKEYFTSKINECAEPLFLSSKPDISFKAERKTFRIEETELLQDFSRKLNTSVFSVILAVTSFYFSRVKNNAENFFIGTTVLNRTGEKERNTMGMYVNTVPVLMKPDYSETVSSNISAVSSEVLAVLRHQKFNYTDVFEETGKGKLFDVIVSYQNAQIVNGETIIEWYSNGMQDENLQIHVEDHDADGTLKMHFDYRTDKFSEDEIDTIHSHIFNLLNDCMENPDKKIGELSMLSEEEKQKLLYEFNDTRLDYNKNTCVYELFEKQVRNNPDKTAVIFKDKKFTYSDLYSLTEEYAGKLVSLGIKTGDTVAVHLERSHMLVVLQLAVLKIGGIFLPLDKRYPEDRINYACKDCNVRLFITDENVKPETTVIGIDELENTETVESETVINNDSCYIIYTSGSTGKPKGCLLTGKGLLNFCLNNNTLETLRNIENCTFACVNAVSFDYFIAESLLPLTNGFMTVILDEEESTIQKKFMAITQKNGINVLMTTPTRLKIYFENEGLEQLKCICTSGEPLTAELLSTMYEKSPEAKIFNPIGPSECSVWDMGGELFREDGIDIHIGKPIANAQIYITDKYMDPVPIGVTGEICIAGDGVGNGYVNNPELTNEKFIDNPFGEGKLYKSGDLGYWRADGNIVFIGRNDFQVKIRGLRIELGEIENAVSEIDGINLSVAVVREDKQGRQFICVFYTSEEKEAKEIKEHISGKLPKYMVPHIFIHLPEMPFTSSGKINRKALPKEIAYTYATEIEPPVNETERLICEEFSRVLGVNEIGRNSDFFELGGTSLSMITLLSGEVFENITAAEFMYNSTPQALSLLLMSGKSEGSNYLEPLYVSENSEKALILTPYGGGGAEAFSEFVKEFTKLYNDVSLYYVGFLHSDDECKKAALEIENKLSDCKITVYSHCAGASVALKIIEKLEKDDFKVENYIAAALIPPEVQTKKNAWQSTPDFVIKHLLDKSGARLGEISKEMQKQILMRFRTDTDYSTRVFSDFNRRIKTPVTVIISRDDYFTRNSDDAEKCWNIYAENVKEIKFIESRSHYFQSDNAEELVKLIDI